MPTVQMNLPYIIASQAQKELTHNDALNALDILAQISVISITNTPPASPVDGDSYIVGTSPTGVWAGQAGKIAAYYSGWAYHAPKEGWRAWIKDVDKIYAYNSSAWAAHRHFLPAGSASAPALTADSDTDTGLYFPSTDTLSLATGGTERAQVTSTGLMGINITPTARLHINNTTNNIAVNVASNEATKQALLTNVTSTSFSSDQIGATNSTAAGTGFNFISCASSGGSDVEFRVRGDGTVFSDGGTAMSTPADYADAFEWEDGNGEGEDRIGFSVVIGRNGKIRIARYDDRREDIIGVVSGNPSVCGRTAWNGWAGKYSRDAFNRPIYEQADYVTWEDGAEDGAVILRGYFKDECPDDVVVPDDAAHSLRPRRKLNPAFIPHAEDDYVPRLLRPEWDAVGLCGCLPLRKGVPTNPRWILLRVINEDVEEWLVR